MRVVDVLVELLLLEGVDCVFTVPGGTAVPILEAVSRRGIRTVVAKDEAGAAHAADGYAWASGRPGVVVTIGGPGATNAITALCCSRVQGNPVVLISGEVATATMGRGAVQDGSDLGLDVLAISRPATALSVAGSTPDKAVFGLFEAFRRALHLSRPVHVSLPLDVQVGSAGITAITRAYRAEAAPALASDSVERAAMLLARAERPAILAGTGARHASEELLALAEMLGAPVATTCGAKGAFPEQHPLSLGVFSFGSGPLARAVLTSDVDVLCAVGTGFGEFSSMNFTPDLAPSRALVHVDRNPASFGRNYDVVPVTGDARAAIGALLPRLRASRVTGTRWFQRFVERTPRVECAEALASNAIPIRPERVMRHIEDALPRDACLVADIGTSCLFAAHYVKLAPPQRAYIPLGWSCMAHPVAASIGVRLGSKRPTLCVTGDAAFLAKGLELHAAVESNLSELVWVVLSNRGHGLVRFGTEKLLGPGHGVEDGDFRSIADAAAIARALGAFGRVVEDPAELETALHEAFAAGRPALLDVRVDPRAEPPMADRIQGLRSATASAEVGRP